MTVVVLTAVPPGLRGDLTRWLMEVAPGVFVGRVTARIRGHLWTRIEGKVRDGWAIMAFPAQNEQGYAVWTAGEERWRPVDHEGLLLVLRPKR